MTSTYDGKRLWKDSIRIETIGAIDELNAFLGLVRSEEISANMEQALSSIQKDLFFLGADLADTRAKQAKLTPAHIKKLEYQINCLQQSVPPLRRFIIPTGTRASAFLHIARTVCRRAERRVVALKRREKVNRSIIAYLGRLSDLLFVMAIAENRLKGLHEDEWRPSGTSQ